MSLPVFFWPERLLLEAPLWPARALGMPITKAVSFICRKQDFACAPDAPGLWVGAGGGVQRGLVGRAAGGLVGGQAGVHEPCHAEAD